MPQSSGELRPFFLKRLVKPRGGQPPQRFDPGAHRQRIARKRSRLVDRAERSHAVHQLSRAAVGRGGQTSADDLAERGEIGLDAIKRLRAAETQAESGDDLVENKQRAVPARNLTQAGEKTRRRRNHTHVCGDRFDDHRGDGVRMRGENRSTQARSL